MPGVRTMKMMKKVMTEGQHVASMEGQRRASIALDAGPHCPRISPCIVPVNSARYTRKNSREKRVGPISQFYPMKPDKPAQLGPSHDDETVAGPYTPCSLSRGSQGSLTGSRLGHRIATLIPPATLSSRGSLTLACLSFLPSHPVETTRALGMTPPPYPLPREGESCRPGPIVSVLQPAYPGGHQGHLIMPRFRPSPFLTRVTTEVIANV